MKNTMKALLVLPLVLSLAGCGSSEPAVTEEVKEETAAETPEEDSSKSGFSPFTAIDTDELTVTVTAVDVESDEPIKLEYENKTADREFAIRYPHVTIDGFEDEDIDEIHVKPGKTAKDQIYNSYLPAMSELGVTFTDFELDIQVFDADTNEAVLEETFHVYPYGEDRAEEFVLKEDMFKAVLLDNDECRISVISDQFKADQGRFSVYTLIENKTDHEIRFRFDQGSVNGTECDVDAYASSVRAGSRCITTLYWEGVTAESIEEASCTIRLLDDNRTETGTETLTYKPE